LTRAHVAGRSDHATAADVERSLRAVVAGDASALFGLAPFAPLVYADACVAAAALFGWPDARPAPTIAPAATLDGVARASALIADVAKRGGRIAIATARPTSLLGFFQRIATVADAAGANVLVDSRGQSDEFRCEGRAGRRLRWFNGVAAVTDGLSLVPVHSVEAASEWLFSLGRPDLAIGDHGFAGAALSAGIATVACADLDAPVFAVAAARALPVTVVPLNDRRPPAAYELLVDRIGELAPHHPHETTH
jgi:hypothetical protein